MLALELESAYQRCVRCGSKKMAFRPEGEMKIPGKLTASPLCAPARVSGLRYAHPVPKRSVPQGREGNHYPLNHPLRQRAHAEATAQRAAREMERANAMSVLIETRMAISDGESISKDGDELEWESLRQAYAASAIDSEDEAVAASAILAFAERTNHAQAACYVGHWHFHGEGSLPQSVPLALAWYEQAALRGDQNGASNRDKLYLSGSSCGPGTEAHSRAVARLREIAQQSQASAVNGAEGSVAAAGWAALARLQDWGLGASPGEGEELNKAGSHDSTPAAAAAATPVEAATGASLTSPSGVIGSGNFGSPPRRWAGASGKRNNGGNNGSNGGLLRTAEGVSEAFGPPATPRGFEGAAVENGMALGVLLAANSYDEFMLALETEKAHRAARSTTTKGGPGQSGWRLKPTVLIPDDALTYRLLPRPRDRLTRKLEALCVPGSAPKGCGFNLPVSSAEFAASSSSYSKSKSPKPLGKAADSHLSTFNFEGAFPLGGPPTPGGTTGVAAKSLSVLRGGQVRSLSANLGPTPGSLSTSPPTARDNEMSPSPKKSTNGSSRRGRGTRNSRGERGPSPELTSRTSSGAQYTTTLHRDLSPYREPHNKASPG